MHVLCPLALGAGIYVGWRSTELLVFRWIESCSLGHLLKFRPEVELPEWLLYCFPDGCWVYAMTSWMLIIWARMMPWVWVGVVMAVGAEIGQLWGVVPGTYDTLDLAFYIGAFITAGVLNAKTYLVDCSVRCYVTAGSG